MKRRLFALLGAAVVLATLAVLSTRWRARGREETRPGPALVRLEPAGGPAEMLGDGHLTKRRAIRAHVPSTLSWRVRVPPRGRLETHLTFAPRSEEELAGVTCTVVVEVLARDGHPRRLVERRVEPFPGWERYVADLGPWGGQEVVISLGVDCAGGEGKRTWSDAVHWSVPVVFGARPPGAVNLLLVTIDTLRADHLHAYGYPRETSPHIDALARRGLVFRGAETVQSATWPALTSLLTSLYPSAHGLIWNGHAPREGLVTLAELLSAKGYSTSAFLTNMKRAAHPGFSRVSTSETGEQFEEDAEVTSLAVEQLRAVRDRPFFLWLHLISPHAGYEPPPPWDRTFTRPGASAVSGAIDELVRIRQEHRPLGEKDIAHIVGLYDGDVAFADAEVGRLLQELRGLGLERSTLVVLTADHGEDLYEHNDYPFHSPSMYGSSLEVPLVLALPGVLPEGESTDHPASLVDIAPTALGLLELPAPSVFQGKNLLPGRRLPSRAVRDRLFSETNGTIHGVRAGGWRLIVNPGGASPGAPGGAYPIAPTELYDLGSDPREQSNLADRQPPPLAGLVADIEEWKARDLRDALPAQALDPQTREELRALGYLVE